MMPPPQVHGGSGLGDNLTDQKYAALLKNQSGAGSGNLGLV